MNRYRRGSSTILASKPGSAHLGAQLKVENPAGLRTIVTLEQLLPVRTAKLRQRKAYLPGRFDLFALKTPKLGDIVPLATRTLHAKRVLPREKDFLDQNGRGVAVTEAGG
jgi:hypothetical protein